MHRTPRRSLWPALLAGIVALAMAAGALVATATGAAAAGNRLVLRALVVDDGSPWARAMVDQFGIEGVPFTRVDLTVAGRPTIDAAFLASGSTANFDAVVLPEDTPAGLAGTELTALAAFEAQFGVRQVDMYNWANPAVGLNYAANPGYTGDISGMTGTVTAAAKADGFGYLTGTLPIGTGSYAFLATPAGPGVMPAGGTFTPYVTLPIPGSTEAGALAGVYRNGNVEKLVVTAAMSTTLSHWRFLAHGVVTWVTRGVHFGYNRNFMTFHFDDAFGYDSRWDPTNNCTPGGDCPDTVTTIPTPIRMTPADVSAVVAWQQQNQYRVTLPFNAYNTLFDNDGNPVANDALTAAFVANQDRFTWLNHGYQHIFQGCAQDVTVVPWACLLTSGTAPATDGSNISWVPQAAIASEITQNITRGRALGLTFDTAEYLSGEHSGLYRTPQQPVDNPQFAAALAQTGVSYIGADASREPGARQVGPATTVPRHPVAVYYNASTEAEEVDEYNWIYTSRAQGGSGYCEDNPTTATCLAAPLDPATGFGGYIVPSDSVNDLRFVMSNDPRPFFAHVSNLTGPDYLGLQLMSAVLDRYNAVVAANAPVVAVSLTEASAVLTRQQQWATAGMGSTPTTTGYLQDGVVTVTSTGTAVAPLTLPGWARLSGGAAFGESYGGERSGWVTGSGTYSVSSASFTSPASVTFAVGTAGTFAVTTTSAGSVPALTVTGTLPAGVTFTDNGDGGATLAGTPAVGTAGAYPLTLAAITPLGTVTQPFTLTVLQAPAFTSAPEAWAAQRRTFSFAVTTSGTPAATVTRTGTLPAGVTFTAGTGGRATLSGTPSGTATPGDYPLTLTATNAAGTVTQAFVLHLGLPPAVTSSANGTATVGTAFSKTVTTSGTPTATVSVTGLPAGLTFTPSAGGGTISGTPAAGTAGVHTVVVTATNIYGSTTQNLTLTVRQVPAFTSPAAASARLFRSTTVTVTTSGYPAASLSRSGAVPLGMTWSARSDGTARISGTPLIPGTYRMTLTATNSAGSATQSFTLTVG